MNQSFPRADIKVRATLEKFDGNAPTKANNFWRILALLGPKKPVEVIVMDDIEGVSVQTPEPDTRWPTARAVKWFQDRRKKNAFD